MDDEVLQATVRAGGVVHFQYGVPGQYTKADIQDTDLAADIGHLIAYRRGTVQNSFFPGSDTQYLVLPVKTETQVVVTGASLPGTGKVVPVPDSLGI